MKKFNTNIGFLLTAIGSAVGFGNIWGFPAQAASYGGSAFVIATLIFSFVIAYPVLSAEFLVGRNASSTGLVNILKDQDKKRKNNNFLKVSSWLMIVNVSLILSFYAIVGGWVIENFTYYYTSNILEDKQIFTDAKTNIFYSFIFLFICFLISKLGFNQGIEKTSKVMMPLLFFILLLLMVLNLFQDGSGEGFIYYLYPDFHKLMDSKVLLSALGQSFFSVTAGLGIMAVYGACLAKDVDIRKYSKIIVFADVLVAFVAGLVVIPAMFVAKKNGIHIFDEGGHFIGGTTLVFDVLPHLFNQLGLIGDIIFPLFFSALLIAGITSALSILEVPVSMMQENFHLSRHRAAFISFMIVFVFSSVISSNIDLLMNVIIKLTTSYIAPVTAIILCFVATKYNQNTLPTTFWGERKYFFNYVKYVCPFIISAIMAYSIFE